MKKYKVIALSVGGSGNKIFHSQEVVNENNFPEGRSKELEEKGFLEEIKPLPNPEPVYEPIPIPIQKPKKNKK